MKDLSDALRSLKTQLDQMSCFCENVMEKHIEDIDEETLLEIEKEFLCCKKKLFNAANGDISLHKPNRYTASNQSRNDPIMTIIRPTTGSINNLHHYNHIVIHIYCFHMALSVLRF